MLKNKKHNTAMDLAYKSVAKLFTDKEELLKACEYCEVEIIENSIKIKYLNIDYFISLNKSDNLLILPSDLSYIEKVYLLHYITSYKNKYTAEIKEEFVGYKNLPGGMFYFSAYRKNGPAKILKAFGSEPEKLYAYVKKFGGSRESFGDISVKLSVFPKIEIIIVLYKGDDEFQPEVQFLYNSDITNYLCLEDISILSGVVAGKITRQLKEY